jgi:hypothetical protein
MVIIIISAWSEYTWHWKIQKQVAPVSDHAEQTVMVWHQKNGYWDNVSTSRSVVKQVRNLEQCCPIFIAALLSLTVRSPHKSHKNYVVLNSVLFYFSGQIVLGCWCTVASLLLSLHNSTSPWHTQTFLEAFSVEDCSSLCDRSVYLLW